MQKRRLYLLLIGVGLVGALFAVMFRSREREPEYGGKRLSEWVDELSLTGLSVETRIKEAQEAMSHIGTNALPYLLEWIGYEQPAWRAKLNRAADDFPSWPWPKWMTHDKKDRRAFGAMSAFEMIGPKAAGAIPVLAKMATHPAHYAPAARAVGALGFIGKDALPPLVAVLTNHHEVLRMGAVDNIGHLGSNALPAVPALIQCLQDTNMVVAMMVPGLPGRLRLEPDLVVPALVRALQDSRPAVRNSAASALGEFGEDAATAVAALLKLLSDPFLRVRGTATNALRRIDPEALERATR